MDGVSQPGNPYFEDADPSQIVIRLLSKLGGCSLLKL